MNILSQKVDNVITALSLILLSGIALGLVCLQIFNLIKCL